MSTFSVDVDTASYAFVRRSLRAGRLPPPEAVRIEEMINYFPYDYPRPASAETPFAPLVTVVPSPWSAETRLMHVALKGYELSAPERPRANLVLLIDVSGSMAPADRLPLLKSALRMLVEELRGPDRVAIVTYANQTRVALGPTPVTERQRILEVIDGLQAGGGTYGEGGLQKAYELAQASFEPASVNRIILATDGDFNIGISDHEQLKAYVAEKRKTGIFLSVLGVGQGNFNDRLMQALAQNGNGVAATIDTLDEARKVLVEQASSKLFTIAKDVKIQIEFNPDRVAEYRLIGYETRALRRQDFDNDRIDAGDVGSGHAVTAVYEIVPVGARQIAQQDLRYRRAEATLVARPAATSEARDRELAFLKLRYKLPAEEESRLITLPVGPVHEVARIEDATDDVRFAIAVAGFGQLLRGDRQAGSFGFGEVAALAAGARGPDTYRYRAEFLALVEAAKLAAMAATSPSRRRF